MSGRSTRLFHVGLVAAVTVLSCATASSQMPENPSVVQTYGSGVHAFFSGDFDRSYDEFTAAIEAGLDDPRARYFRGLAALRLGRLDEAEADFSDGADLEARGSGGWPVSQSLERVQGHDRLRLERHRVRARVANIQRIKAAEKQRLRETEAAQPGVLRGRAPEAVTMPRSDGSNPFADQSEAGAGDSGDASQPDARDPLPSPETPDAGTPDPGTPDQGTPDPGTPDPGTDGVAGDGLDAEMEKPADTPAEAVDAKPDAAGEDESPLTNPADEPASGDSKPPMVEQPDGTDPATPTDPAPTEPATPEPGTPEPATPEPGTPEPGTPEPGTPEPGTPEPTTGEPATPVPDSSQEDPFGDKEAPPPAAGADAPMAEDKKDEAAADGQ